MDYDLKKYMNIYAKRGLSLKLIKKFMKQILTGVNFIHSQKVIHRDLKPHNILLNIQDINTENNTHEPGVMKIADFGLARIFSFSKRVYSKEILTLWYRAPEIILGYDEYSSNVDIWSLGCIMAELYTNTPLIQADNNINQLNIIFK